MRDWSGVPVPSERRADRLEKRQLKQMIYGGASPPFFFFILLEYFIDIIIIRKML